jgi:hypothetical protein
MGMFLGAHMWDTMGVGEGCFFCIWRWGDFLIEDNA